MLSEAFTIIYAVMWNEFLIIVDDGKKKHPIATINLISTVDLFTSIWTTEISCMEMRYRKSAIGAAGRRRIIMFLPIEYSNLIAIDDRCVLAANACWSRLGLAWPMIVTVYL